jgi:glucan phosphoethanolaminetransferase (alkaline phosphatase superfamily)
MQAGGLIRRFGLDIVAWYCLPAFFLAAYVGLFAEPRTAVAPHLLVVTLPLLALAVARLTLQQLVSSPGIRRLLVAILTASLLGLLITYYSLVLIGLRSWGGVVAWNVIPTFFAQTTVAADALGVPLFLFPIAALLVYAGLIFICWKYLARFDWAGPASARIPRTIRVTFAVSATAVLAIQTYQVSAGQWTQLSEPVSLTFFPPRAALDLEGYSVNPVTASRLDQLEDKARAAYIPAPSATARRNLVLIVVDALRPDHMGIYGYDRDTTPSLARISGAHCTRMIGGTHSSCGDTGCALFSLFTSKFPNEFSFRPFTLHEALRRNGYHIHMVLSGDHTYFHSGFKRFYGAVDSFYDGTQAHGYFLNDDQLVVDHVARMPDWDGQPVMFQFHLMSTHILRKKDDVPGKFQPARRYALRDSIERGPGGDPPQSAVNFYDNGVLQADSMIDALLLQLQNKGYLRNTLVVITADHGESLGEHGLFTHANSVREEVLRVPLLLISYGYQPQPSGPMRALPSQIDIAPTILSELSLPIPSTWTGRPLNEAQGVQFSTFEEHTFAGLIDHRDPQHAWKHWIDRRSGVDHVFDLSVDPHENRDVRDGIPPELLNELRAHTRAQTSAD